jgi:hypothetical protein
MRGHDHRHQGHITMKKSLSCYLFITACGLLHVAHAGELKKDYFGSTKPGDWITQELSSPDGSRSTYVSTRLPDEDGRAVVELSVKVIKGPGEGSESKNTIHLPVDFNFARDWLSYGKFTEKMSMEYSGTVMPIDENTLTAIRNSSKDYRNAVTFVGTETVDGYQCDHYTYAVSIGDPVMSEETGDLWLSDQVPFGIVRQSATSLSDNKRITQSYEIRLTETGGETDTSETTVESAPEEISEPSSDLVSRATVSEAYESGLLALDMSVTPGTGGRELQMTLRNKTDHELTVILDAGYLTIPGELPVEELQMMVKEYAEIILPPESSSDPVAVRQRGTRGPVEGTFTLSVYEGTHLFTGSTTVDSLAK